MESQQQEGTNVFPTRKLINNEMHLIYGSQSQKIPKADAPHLQFTEMEADILSFYKLFPNGLIDYYGKLDEKCHRYRSSFIDYLSSAVASQEVTELGLKLKLYSFVSCQIQFLQSEYAHREIAALRSCLTKNRTQIVSCSRELRKLMHRGELLLTNVAKIEKDLVQRVVNAKEKCQNDYTLHASLDKYLSQRLGNPGNHPVISQTDNE